MRSRKVEAPGVVQLKLISVTDRKVSGPVVRSRSTSYESTCSSSARSAASILVRLVPGTLCSLCQPASSTVLADDAAVLAHDPPRLSLIDCLAVVSI
jgi:hypothetical protein